MSLAACLRRLQKASLVHRFRQAQPHNHIIFSKAYCQTVTEV